MRAKMPDAMSAYLRAAIAMAMASSEQLMARSERGAIMPL